MAKVCNKYSYFICSALLIVLCGRTARSQGSSSTVASSTDFTTAGSGSGEQDETTTASDGSGFGTTFTQGFGGVSTTDSFMDSSGSGSTEVTTSDTKTTFTSSIFDGSGGSLTTVFEITTDANTTSFEASTGAVAADGFPWYIIVIVVCAVIILILIIIVIVVCCKLREPGAALLQKATPKAAAENTETDATEPARRAVAPAPTILPPERIEEPKVNFVSSSPMRAPIYLQDSSASVRKRDKARSRSPSGVSSFDGDDEFNQPLVKRTAKTPKKRAKRRKPPMQNAQEGMAESETDLAERTISYQPYFLPTPMQTALTGKAIGDQLTDEAMAERHYLQRSDIERHKNKQRLRKQRAQQQNDPFNGEQRTIDAVLQPLPPKALQGIQERRRLQKHGLIDNANEPMRKPSRRKSKRNYSERSTTSDDTTASEEKRPAHETVIAKMTKLLEDAYALLAPAVQKTTVKPLKSGNDQGVPQSIPMQPLSNQLMASHQIPSDQRLFTRTNTPPALLPQSDTNSHASHPRRANDSMSPVWTPYRAFDRIQDLQKQDPTLSYLANTRPATSGQDITMPKTLYLPNSQSSFSPPSFSLPPGVHDPFAPTPSVGSTAGPGFQAQNQSKNFIDDGVDEPAVSIVQSIKDTLAELAGKQSSDTTAQDSNC